MMPSLFRHIHTNFISGQWPTLAHGFAFLLGFSSFFSDFIVDIVFFGTSDNVREEMSMVLTG